MRDTFNEPRSARSWLTTLAKYREPTTSRSLFELAVTIGPFLGIWALAWAALSISPWLSLALAMANGTLLVRIFIIQHDCGHGSFLSNRRAQDWVGRVLGVMTLTPYAVWKRTHQIHHSHHGNLDERGIGDVTTLTVAEYQKLSPMSRLMYRIYRSPLVLFVIGPSYLFMLQNRLPIGLMRAGRQWWISAMGTNLALVALLGGIYYFGGWAPILWIYLPTTAVASSIGVWLFYVQHQFEETIWDHEENWQLHEHALEGSSHYVLPAPLRWLSGNIGIHHVHHLYSRIPFYRLTEVLRDHKELAEAQRLTIGESIATARLHLWDETERKLTSFKEARRKYNIA